MSRPRLAMEMLSVIGLKVFNALKIALIMPKNCAGIFSIVRPRKLLICESAIKRAIPFVKPTMTAIGIKRTKVPKRKTHITNKRMPDMKVAMRRLVIP